MKNLKTFRLFIGQNNQTKKVEKNIINKQALEYFPDGLTVYDTKGAWLGGHEKAVIVELITNNRPKVLNLTKKLKELLKQDAILLQEIPATSTFV